MWSTDRQVSYVSHNTDMPQYLLCKCLITKRFQGYRVAMEYYFVQT